LSVVITGRRSPTNLALKELEEALIPENIRFPENLARVGLELGADLRAFQIGTLGVDRALKYTGIFQYGSSKNPYPLIGRSLKKFRFSENK